MSDPLVWLPFPVDEVGEVPETLRYEVYDGEGDLPPGTDEVQLWVTPYRFSASDGELVQQLPELRVLQTLSAGIEHIAPWIPDGVTLCNGRGIHDASTAELTLALVLASLRGIPDYVRAQDRGSWAPDKRPSLADKRVLIVGYGQIGAAIEQRMVAFECGEVTRVARSARDGVHAIDELPALLPMADVVVLVVPGTTSTTGLFDTEMLARVQDDALLVNVSRGPVVDTDALLAELQSGRIHAALDVVDPEPLPDGHPMWRAPNLLIAPHVGGNSDAMDTRGYRLVREQLARFAAGEPLANVVTGDY